MRSRSLRPTDNTKLDLRGVRNWARAQGFTRRELRSVERAALLHVVSRLFQAIYRESKAGRHWQDSQKCWHLDVGHASILRVRTSGPLPFRRLEVVSLPRLVDPARASPLRSVRRLATALAACLQGTEYEPLVPVLISDLLNSVANVVLNRLIARGLAPTAAAIEPASFGHQYYPLPALRIGPSLEAVLRCSHLTQNPVLLPLLEMSDCRLVSPAFTEYGEWLETWSGLTAEPGCAALLPVHPWQLELSPVIRAALDAGLARQRGTVAAIPLASQRTCRVVGTGFDLKLPVDVTLTGEHRLLHRLNCENACAVSALAVHLRSLVGCDTLDFQQDIAAIYHSEPTLVPHLSAIVRSPAPAGPAGDPPIPALNLWCGPRIGRDLLANLTSARSEEFFYRYCKVLMTGPVRYCSEQGMAFEPHLQNVFVAISGGMPCAIVLRDLDASVLDPHRIRPALRAAGLGLAPGTWEEMPAFDIGARRTVQALLFGHLGEVMSQVTEVTGVTLRRLTDIVEDNWSELACSAPSRPARLSVERMRDWSDAVKRTLWTRLTRGSRVEFVDR